MAPHSPAPSQTPPPHQSQPGFPMAESQMFCLVKPFIPGTEIQTQPELVPPRRVPNKRTPWFYAVSVPLYKSHSLFLQCPQLLPLSVSIHLAGSTSLYRLCYVILTPSVSPCPLTWLGHPSSSHGWGSTQSSTSAAQSAFQTHCLDQIYSSTPLWDIL